MPTLTRDGAGESSTGRPASVRPPAGRTGCGTAPRSGRRRASSSACVPRSTIRPSSSTRIRSAAADRRQPVRDDDRGPALERLGQRLLHRRLRRRVEVRGGLVEHHDPRPGEQHAGRWSAAGARRRTAGSRARRRPCPARRAATRPGRPAGPGAARPTARRSSASGRASSRLARTDSWNRWPSWVTMPSVSRIVAADRSRTSTPAEADGAGVRRRTAAAAAARSSTCPRRTSRPARPAGPARRGTRRRAAPRRRRGCRAARPPRARRARPCPPTGRRSGRRRARPTPARPAAACGVGRVLRPAARGRAPRRPARS